jgi:hypothetical protein
MLWALTSNKQMNKAQSLYEHAYNAKIFQPWLTRDPPVRRKWNHMHL